MFDVQNVINLFLRKSNIILFLIIGISFIFHFILFLVSMFFTNFHDLQVFVFHIHLFVCMFYHFYLLSSSFVSCGQLVSGIQNSAPLTYCHSVNKIYCIIWCFRKWFEPEHLTDCTQNVGLAKPWCAVSYLQSFIHNVFFPLYLHIFALLVFYITKKKNLPCMYIWTCWSESISGI